MFINICGELMSVRRIKLITDKLIGKNYATRDDILEYLSRNDMHISRETFFRDLRKIESDFGIELSAKKVPEGNRTVMGYRIEDIRNINLDETIAYINSVSAIELLKVKFGRTIDLAQYISPGRGMRWGGALWLDKTMQALTTTNIVRFFYQKYDDPMPSERLVEPYYLKSHNQTWYLLGKETETGIMKLFGLDRVTDLEITAGRFERDPDFNPALYFENYIGVYTGDKPEPEIITIDVRDPFAHKLRVNPLHPSQNIIADTAEAIRLTIFVSPGGEFYTEILKLRMHATIISPESVRLEMKQIVEAMATNYT
jgi:hypothetical protein